MAIDGSSPTRTRESAEFSGGTDELGALLVGYAGVLEEIDDAPAILWTKLEGHRLLQWLRVPAPRFLVHTLLVRHVSLCVSALKRSAARRAALAGDPQPQRDLKMLEHFEQSLPTRVRPALIWPLAALGVLLVAYLLAHFIVRASYSALLGDLLTAAAKFDFAAAVDAFKSSHLGLDYFGTASIMAWSAMLAIMLLLLPAFAIKRRLVAQVAGLEERSSAALGARRVHDIELDLVAQFLLVAPVFAIAVLLLVLAFSGEYDPVDVAISTVGAILLVVLTAFAGVELASRYRVRGAGIKRRHGRITRLPLLLVSVVSVGAFIFVSTIQLTTGQEVDQPPVSKGQIGQAVPIKCQLSDHGEILTDQCELYFTVTAIQQNAACADPYRPLKPGQQFLRFDLDVWSPVDRFSDPELANALRPSHWGVEGGDGVLERDVYTKCGDGAEAMSQPIVPDTHTKPVVVISAPKPAVVLQLDIPDYGVWRYSIPPVGS